MYSYEEWCKAVRLYIKYGLRSGPVLRELGYPTRRSLINWYQEYKNEGKLRKKYHRAKRYSRRERKRAIRHYLEHGKCIAFTIRELGYPSRTLLSSWIKEDLPEEKKLYSRSRPCDTFDLAVKERAVIDLCSRSGCAKEIAERYGVQRETLYLWKQQLLPAEGEAQMKKRKTQSVPDDVEGLKKEISTLRNETVKLQEEIYRLRLERDVLEKAAEIIKKARASILKI